MPLKILLADDSMTAQRLGKEYLVSAGHEVTAVSNGAAAMKKIAEFKPNLIVLDVYMPGYSGLEVCEKVKAAKETAAIPVLLTYAAMEPFKPEDGNRVKADGVLVKPFDQAVLLAAVKKFEQKMKPAEPEYEKTMKLTADQIRGFQEDASFQEWAATAEAVPEAEAAEARISVPQEMAAAPAFGLDDLLGEMPAAPASPVFETALPEPEFARGEAGQAASAEAGFDMPAAEASPAELSFDMPSSAAPDASAANTLEEMMSAVSAPAPAADPFADFAAAAAPVESVLPEPDFSMPMPLPEPAAASVEFETAEPPPSRERTYTSPLIGAHAASIEDTQLMPPVIETDELPGTAVVQVTPEPLVEYTSAPQEDVAIAAAPGLEPTVLQTEESSFGSSVEGMDPALVTDPNEMAAAFPTRFGVEHPDEIVVGVAAEMPGLYADAAPAVEEAASVEDTQVIEPPPEPEPEPEPMTADAELVAAMAAQPETIVAEPEPLPTVEEVAPPPPEPVVTAAPDAKALEEEMARAFASLPLEPAPPAPAAEPQIAAAMAAAVGASVPVAASSLPSAAAALDPATLADIVSRVTERVKAELVAEIMRELERRK